MCTVSTKASGSVFRVLFFERGADDAWGPTQTLVLNRAIEDVKVGIGGAAAVVASFVSDGNDRYNTTTNGRIIGCNATVPTTPMPSTGTRTTSASDVHAAQSGVI